MLFDLLHRRPIVAEVHGFPGYYADTEGRVFSTRLTGIQAKAGPERRRFAWLALNPHPRTGHLRVVMFDAQRKQRTIGVHRAVLLAFDGPPPPGAEEACHQNGDPADNRLANLRWDSTGGNAWDREQHRRDRQQRRQQNLLDIEVQEGARDRWEADQEIRGYVPDPEFGF